MKKYFLPLSVLLFLSTLAYAQIGEFEKAEDIGNPKIKGSSSYNTENQTYTLKGGGSNIWFNHDEFHFLYKKLKGDFMLTANFQLIGNEDGNGHRKTGWMIRESTDHDAVSVNSCLHGDGLVVLQWRLMRGAYMRDPEEEIFFPKQYFGETIIQLERIGKTITMRMAHPGEPLEDMGSVTLPELKDEVLIGPYALAHDPDDIQEARIWNVSMVKPVAPSWHPNRLVKTISRDDILLNSKIETIEIKTGKRNVVYEENTKLESPYFDPSGSTIFFKKNGQKNEVNLKTKKSNLSNSGSEIIDKINDGSYTYFTKGTNSTNQIWRKKGEMESQLTWDLDHAWFPHVSPDGKHLAYLSFPHDAKPTEAVSYQRVSIKVLPLDGGGPRTVAYFYGGKGSFENYSWSPDGKSLVFMSNF